MVTEAQRMARAGIDSKLPYAVRGTALSRMEAVGYFAAILSWAKDRHRRMPWDMDEVLLAMWQEHYDRAVHAYTRPFEPYRPKGE
jgi:hypothetical protein